MRTNCHVVIDHDHRRGLVDTLDDADQPVDLLTGHARGGLVEQQQPRPLHEHDGRSRPTGVARARARRRCAARCRRSAVRSITSCDDATRIGEAVHAARGEPEVFLDRQAVHHRRHLRLDADAQPHDLVRAPAGQHPGRESAPAAGATLVAPAGQALEETALAGTVRSDQATQLAFAERKRHVVDRTTPPKRIVRSRVSTTALMNGPLPCEAGKG